MMKTTKLVIVLSIGSETAPWPSDAWRTSEPPCRSAATIRSVPAAGHAAEDDRGDGRRDDRRDDARAIPATATHSPARSRRT